jgi:hypothetical protein
MMEAVNTPETLVNFFQTTWHNIPKDNYSTILREGYISEPY